MVKAKAGGSLAQQAYERICARIIDGSLPPGTSLAQEHIADLIGVSRTPIRDALAKAALENLVTLIPGRGYVVNDVTDQDLHDTYEVRYTLETMAVRQACGRHTRQQLVRLRALIEEMEVADPADVKEIVELGIAFHLGLSEPCPNAYLRRLLISIYDHPIQRRISMKYNIGPAYQVEVGGLHRRILEALTDRDEATVVTLLRQCHNGSSHDC